MKRQRHPKTILTNDPSMTAWGWAVLDFKGNILKTGCIKTAPDSKKKNLRKGDDRVRRAAEIINQLHEIVDEFNVKLIISEQPHGSQNASAAVMIGMVIGMLQAFAIGRNVGIEWYSEGDVKRELFHRQAVAKKEMIDYISQKLSFQFSGTKYIDEAVADSLGVYLTAVKQSSTVQMLKELEG
jgi:Holliday junction resolvasome RuvABC endonuclease subunit